MGNPVTLHSFGKGMRMTPSLPQRGRQPKGGIPLTLFIHFSRLEREFLVNPQRAIAFFMDSSTGVEAKVAAA